MREKNERALYLEVKVTRIDGYIAALVVHATGVFARVQLRGFLNR